MAFDSWANPEVITAICVGVGAILGAIGTFISKLKGKNIKEILSDQNKEQLDTIKDAFHTLAEVTKKEVDTIKSVVEKQKKEKEKKA